MRVSISLTIANGVRAEITINPADNGNFSVTGMIPGNGCTVLFNPRGAVVQQGSSCSQKEIRKAQDAMDAYLREQNASDDDENRRGGNYADSDAGGPDFWEITRVPNNDLGLKTEPSLNSSFRVKGLHNGTVLRNLGCENHGGDRWCRVEGRDNPSQNGWARMQYLRESGGSSHHNGSHHNSSHHSGTLQPGMAEIVGAGRNGIDLPSSAYTQDRPNATGLRNGTSVRIQSCTAEGWCRVELQDGSKITGWLRTSNLRQ